ncbi:MAG TPA: alpha/beta hydrolase [Baekduia sp.]|nr:alpha/beta hydrolase [Baekduia sp.]
MTERDVGALHVYEAGARDAPLVVVWHHGTPNVGAPPEPLLGVAGIRWVSYDRPGYGGSAPRPGRDVASAAADVEVIADALGVEELAVMGHSGGAVHALACAALLGERVVGAVCGSGLAPRDADGLDWFAGMGPGAAAELRAAERGRDALAEQLASAPFDPELFTPADHAALAGPWGWLGRVAEQALEGGADAMIDDDLAYVAPWGFDPADVRVPVLVLHGDEDRMVPAAHGRWLADRIPGAELWLRPGDGHVSVLSAAAPALAWLAERSTPPHTRVR